jgi:hypothetical protein
VTRRVTAAERRARLARRHLLVPEARTDDVAAIAQALVALHSSDPVSVYLSAAARMAAPSLVAVDRALYEERSVLRHHGMRRTLWVATPETMRAVHGAATRKLVGPERRRTVTLLRDSGVPDPDGWLDDARARALTALHEHGPMTARQLGDAVPALRQPLVLGAGKKYEATVAAHTRVLLQLGFEGVVVRTRPTGTWVNGAYTYAAMDTWVPGGLGDLDEKEAATRLADAWLRRFGPATSADLQWWAGWTARLTGQALVGCGAEPVLVEVEPGEEPVPGWVAAGDGEPVEPVGDWVAVLPGLDPTIMGWRHRSWYLPGASAEVFDRNGNAGPAVWVDGQVVGAWMQAPDGTIRTRWFSDVSRRSRNAVAEEVDRLADLVGETRFTVRFPGVAHKTLLG